MLDTVYLLWREEMRGLVLISVFKSLERAEEEVRRYEEVDLFTYDIEKWVLDK